MIGSRKKCMLSFLAGNLSLYFFLKLKNTKEVGDDKDKRYCRLFDNWLALNERGDSFERFFEERNIKEIAVYGYGNIGKHLVAQLSGSDISIKYVIDKRKDRIATDGIPCCQLSENMPRVDAIVITPICEYSEINNRLKKVTSAELLSMEDIIYELL